MRRLTLGFLTPVLFALSTLSGCFPPDPPRCTERVVSEWQPSEGIEAHPVLDECKRHVGYEVTIDTRDGLSRTWTLSRTARYGAGEKASLSANVEAKSGFLWAAKLYRDLNTVYDDSAASGDQLLARAKVSESGPVTSEFRVMAIAGIRSSVVIRDLTWE